MSEEEKRETEKNKREGSKKGQQYVANTAEAKQARKGSHAPPIKNYDDLNVGDIREKLGDLSDKELKQVRDYEKNNANRKTLIEQVDRKLL